MEFFYGQVVEYRGVLYMVECDIEGMVYLLNEDKAVRVEGWDREDVLVRNDIECTFKKVNWHDIPILTTKTITASS